MVDDERSSVIRALLHLLGTPNDAAHSKSGHVVAAACAGLAFLACHPIGAQGDACMTGPHRKKLLDAGAFHALLSALSDPPEDPSCKPIVEESAAIGFMYLSTMVTIYSPCRKSTRVVSSQAEEVEESTLRLLSTLLKRTKNLKMLEYLMAGMWILLRSHGNRNILAKAFDRRDNSVTPTDTETRIAAAIEVHELTEERMQQEDGSADVDREMCGDRPDASEAEGDGQWGLMSLVTVGESWLQDLTASTPEDPDASILKLFEFLTASLCLFMTPDDGGPDPKPSQIFEYNTDR